MFRPNLTRHVNGLTEMPESASGVSSTIEETRIRQALANTSLNGGVAATEDPAPLPRRSCRERAWTSRSSWSLRFPARSANTRLQRHQAGDRIKQGRAMKGGHTADVKRRRDLNQVGTHELQAM